MGTLVLQLTTPPVGVSTPDGPHLPTKPAPSAERLLVAATLLLCGLVVPVALAITLFVT